MVRAADGVGGDDGAGTEPVDLDMDIPDARPDLREDNREDMRVDRPDDLGEPCMDAADCLSPFCILVRGMERVCTRRCASDDECPDGWLCRQVSNAGVDITFICVPEDAACAGADLQTDPEHCGECENACEAEARRRSA